MNKIVYVVFITMLFSCKNEKKTLPNSTGNSSEILVVTEEAVWLNKSHIIKSIFETPIHGSNKIEPSYNIIHINHFEFKNIFKRNKHIILLAKDIQNITQKDKWARDQLVVTLKIDENEKVFHDKLQKIKQIFEAKELQSLRKDIITNSKKDVERAIYKNFDIHMLIPFEYTVIENRNDFFWASYNPEKIEEIRHVMVFSINKKIDDLQQCLTYTDSIFSSHLFGSEKKSYVKIEPLYEPFCENNICKGLWKLENGFMGGSFVMKKHIKNNRTVITTGLIFAPQKDKRNFLKNLEAIL